jgi:hypothetical protein
MYPQVQPGRGPSAQAPGSEGRLTLIHRVLVPSEPYPIEYAIIVTDRRSIFIRQAKTRSGFVLRGEMRYGTALVTDIVPKTLEDYERTTIDSLATEVGNFAVSHKSVVSFTMRKDEPEFSLPDVFVWLTMRRQGEVFQVYNFELNWQTDSMRDARVRFYAVPLGAYFKPRRQTKKRETILREYALDVLGTFQKVLTAGIVRV